SKTTTSGQYEKLAEMMAAKRDIAQGFQQRPTEEMQAFWNEVATSLNALGPPSKDSNARRKVWIDWKRYIKRELSNNKKEMMSAGGGQCPLQRIAPLEEQVIELTGLITCTSGIRGVLDFGDSAQVQHDTETEMDISASSVDPDGLPSTSREFYADTKKFNEAAMNRMEEMATHLRRMNRSLEKVADTAAKQLQEEQRHNKIKEELLKRKIEIKMEMLRLEHPDHNID
ncbi:uncharacterized protein LOC118755422, partial [Rhagoletis pomonella]|uniref:uncharacterized protein LOC118755422 n=1 Tax=Rhagoletis pomonella TaxID=28610 RepID=UPI00177C997A